MHWWRQLNPTKSAHSTLFECLFHVKCHNTVICSFVDIYFTFIIAKTLPWYALKFTHQSVLWRGGKIAFKSIRRHTFAELFFVLLFNRMLKSVRSVVFIFYRAINWHQLNVILWIDCSALLYSVWLCDVKRLMCESCFWWKSAARQHMVMHSDISEWNKKVVKLFSASTSWAASSMN